MDHLVIPSDMSAIAGSCSPSTLMQQMNLLHPRRRRRLEPFLDEPAVCQVWHPHSRCETLALPQDQLSCDDPSCPISPFSEERRYRCRSHLLLYRHNQCICRPSLGTRRHSKTGISVSSATLGAGFGSTRHVELAPYGSVSSAQRSVQRRVQREAEESWRVPSFSYYYSLGSQVRHSSSGWILGGYLSFAPSR
jgi:hypothetical protein